MSCDQNEPLTNDVNFIFQLMGFLWMPQLYLTPRSDLTVRCACAETCCLSQGLLLRALPPSAG